MSTITDVSSPNKKWRGRPLLLASAAALEIVLGAGAASAQTPPCSSLPAPVIYGLGGSATKPLLGKVAAGLAAAPTPLTIVYQAPGACVGINGLLGGTPITGTASYWDATGKESSCTVDVPHAVDFANMGNTAVSCPGVVALPADIGDFAGPVNTYNLIVPVASSQTVISSEAAYFAFGFGAQGQAQPWVDETQLFRRDESSAAQLFISLATGVPAAKFKGINTLTNSGTVTQTATATKPEAALGLVSGEVADAARASVRTLAYQHKGQRCGFLPDSSSTSFDKKNVRTGQYHIWAPIHFFARVDAAKKIVDPNVASFIGLFTGEVTPPSNIDILALEIKSGNVPRCAMNVWRETDLGPLAKNTPEKPCGCFFEKTATGATTCTACATADGTADVACPVSAPVCRRNFCEAR
ncbi:MAG: hypothetical protein JWP97_6131 [Labilithrix sp.]|nr:hypothetical protein [Labilithrix sp.]